MLALSVHRCDLRVRGGSAPRRAGARRTPRPRAWPAGPMRTPAQRRSRRPVHRSRAFVQPRQCPNYCMVLKRDNGYENNESWGVHLARTLGSKKKKKKKKKRGAKKKKKKKKKKIYPELRAAAVIRRWRIWRTVREGTAARHHVADADAVSQRLSKASRSTSPNPLISARRIFFFFFCFFVFFVFFS
jgi:hypothetical protein